MRSATGLNRSLYGATTMRGSGSAIGLVGGNKCMHDCGMSIVDKNLIEKARELGEKFRLYRNIKTNMRGGAMSGEGKKGTFLREFSGNDPYKYFFHEYTPSELEAEEREVKLKGIAKVQEWDDTSDILLSELKRKNGVDNIENKERIRLAKELKQKSKSKKAPVYKENFKNKKRNPLYNEMYDRQDTKYYDRIEFVNPPKSYYIFHKYSYKRTPDKDEGYIEVPHGYLLYSPQYIERGDPPVELTFRPISYEEQWWADSNTLRTSTKQKFMIDYVNTNKAELEDRKNTEFSPGMFLNPDRLSQERLSRIYKLHKLYKQGVSIEEDEKAPDPDIRAVVPEEPDIRRPAVHEEPEAPNIFINENPKYEKNEPDPVADKKQMIAMKRKEEKAEAKAKAEVEAKAKAKAERQAIIDKEDEEEERAFMARLEREEKLKIRENKIKKDLADRWTESDEDYLKRVDKKERAYKIREKKEEKAEKDSKEEKAPMKAIEKKAEKKAEKKVEKKVEKLENKIEELKEVIVELKEDKKEMAGSPSKKIKCRICGVVFDNYHLMSPVHLEALAKRKAERLRLKEEDKKNNPEKYERLARERKQRANVWITHLKAYREANPDVSYKVAMQRAKATYNR